jgi:lipopolysaccharide biosynthesis regulator YciM
MRFSIRDLLWLTLVVAMGFGWWAERRAAEARHDDILDSLNAQVTADIAAGRLDEAGDRMKRFMEFREMMRGRSSEKRENVEDDFKLHGKVKIEFAEPSSEVRLGSPP